MEISIQWWHNKKVTQNWEKTSNPWKGSCEDSYGSGVIEFYFGYCGLYISSVLICILSRVKETPSAQHHLTFWWKNMSQTYKYQLRWGCFPLLYWPHWVDTGQAKAHFNQHRAELNCAAPQKMRKVHSRGLSSELHQNPVCKVTFADLLSCLIRERPEFHSPMRRSASFYTTLFFTTSDIYKHRNSHECLIAGKMLEMTFYEPKVKC